MDSEETAYPSRREAKSSIQHSLMEAGLQDGVAEQCVQLLEREFIRVVDSKGANFGYNLLTRKWVLRNSDLDVLELASPIAIAGASMLADMSSSPSLAAFVASAVISVIQLRRRISEYACTVSTDQFKVLTVLKMYRGQYVPVLLVAKTLNVSDKNSCYSADEITAILIDLIKLRDSNGRSMNIVNSDNRGYWSASNY